MCLNIGGTMMRKISTRMSVLLSITVLLLLSACVGPSAEENMYNKLEKVVELEDKFKDQQQPLVEIEQKESKLYNEIMSLGMKEFDKIVALSKEALSLVEERESKLKAEYDSIMSSKEEFESVGEEIEKIEDVDLEKKAKELKETMIERYKSYESLYKNYESSISLDKELYSMLQNEDLTMEELESQINDINDSYKKVIEQNEKFNTLTEEYNNLKLEFYEQAELNIDKSE